MAKISQLPPIDPAAIDGHETLPVVKDGTTGRATLAALVQPTLDAATILRDQAADLVRPSNIFVDVSLEQAEAAIAPGGIFKLVDSAAGIAQVRRRTASGSDKLYDEATTAALASTAPGRGASLVFAADGATLQHAIAVAANLSALLANTDALAVGSTVRTANGYIYDVLPSDAPAFHETDAPDGYHLATAGGAKLRLKASDFVTPEMFGGDLHLAAAYAAVFKVTLMTGPVDYEITRAFEPHDLTWISDNTRIKQMYSGGGMSVLRPRSNVKHIGRTYLYLPYQAGGSANRAFVLFGNWETETGYENFHFDEFVFEGGHPNCNGFSVAGNSHHVRGRRIDAGTSTMIGRVFMAHWGNFNGHYNDGGTYRHKAGAGPTTHPHDIVIDEVFGNVTISTGDFCALWCVSAGYDIRAGRVEGSMVNNGAGPGSLVLFMGGDLAFAYATPEERAHGMKGLEIGSVVGRSSHKGIDRIGRALHYNTDSTPQPAENYYAKIQETVGTVDIENTVGSNVYRGVDGYNGYGRSRYGHIRARNYMSAVAISNRTYNFTADLIEAIDCRNIGIHLAGYAEDESEWPANISIGTIRVDGTGLSTSTSGEANVTNIDRIVSLRIGKVIVDKLKTMGTFSAGTIQIGANVRGVTIDNVFQPWTGAGQTVCVINSANADKFVDVGHIRAPVGLVPVSGGVTSRVIGRNREYHYYGGAVPAGITVRLGDRFVASAATAGQHWISIVTRAGITGADAQVSGFLPGA